MKIDKKESLKTNSDGTSDISAVKENETSEVNLTSLETQHKDNFQVNNNMKKAGATVVFITFAVIGIWYIARHNANIWTSNHEAYQMITEDLKSLNLKINQSLDKLAKDLSTIEEVNANLNKFIRDTAQVTSDTDNAVRSDESYRSYKMLNEIFGLLKSKDNKTLPLYSDHTRPAKIRQTSTSSNNMKKTSPQNLEVQDNDPILLFILQKDYTYNESSHKVANKHHQPAEELFKPTEYHAAGLINTNAVNKPPVQIDSKLNTSTEYELRLHGIKPNESNISTNTVPHGKHEINQAVKNSQTLSPVEQPHKLNAYQQMSEKNRAKKHMKILSFVPCEHLKFISVNSARISPSPNALHLCWKDGITRNNIQNGVISKRTIKETNTRKLENTYVHCADVFNDNLDRFTSQLLNDYALCKKSNALNNTLRNIIENKFQKLFSIIQHGKSEVKHITSHGNKTPVMTITNNLVQCKNASLEVRKLCKNIGVTIKQITTLIWNVVDDKWLITEDLSDLYLACNDIFAGNHLDAFTVFPLKEYYGCLLNSFINPQPQFIQGVTPRFTVTAQIP